MFGIILFSIGCEKIYVSCAIFSFWFWCKNFDVLCNFFFQFGVILLITSPKIPECAGDIWPSSVYGKLARLLATGVSLIHLRDGFFFLFQV